MKNKRGIREILSGDSIFLQEYEIDDAWQCRIIRSTIIRGEISEFLVDPEFINLDAQLIQRHDVPGIADLQLFDESVPILSGKDIHYYGQPIALLIARSVEELNQAESMIQIRYQEYERLPEKLLDPQQIYRQAEKVQGNPGLMWEKSVESVESSYYLGPQFEVHQETSGALAHWEDEKLVIVAPTIWPHQIIRSMVSVTGISSDRLRITPTNPGIFHDHLLVDGTIHALFAGIAAEVSGRSIMLQLSEEERLLFGTRQPPINVRHHVGLDSEKTVLVNDVVVDVNTGAFGLFTSEMLNQIMSAAVGMYRSSAWRLRVHLYRSNLPPMSIFHGFPVIILQVPVEVQANRMADFSQIDPLSWRLEQHLETGETAPPQYLLKNPPDTEGILGQLGEISDFSRRYAANELLRKRRSDHTDDTGTRTGGLMKGMGMAYGFHPGGFSHSTEKMIRPQVRIKMETDGLVHAYVYTAPGSSAAKLYIRRIIREELNIDEEQIILHTSDIQQVPDSGPLCLSRSLTIVMDVLRQACRKLQKQRFNQALPIDITSSLGNVGKKVWDQDSFTGNPYRYRSYGALALSVELNPLSYIADIPEIWMVVDSPDLLNINQTRHALEGGILQSLEWVRGWHGEFTHGVLHLKGPVSRRYRESKRNPKISIEFRRTNESAGGKSSQSGFRDLPFALVPAAYLSALSQATGGYFDQVPIDSQSIFSHLHGTEDDKHED